MSQVKQHQGTGQIQNTERDARQPLSYLHIPQQQPVKLPSHEWDAKYAVRGMVQCDVMLDIKGVLHAGGGSC
eukprot:353764-Chlamydomonas_euryale.AAC.4